MLRKKGINVMKIIGIILLILTFIIATINIILMIKEIKRDLKYMKGRK